MLTVNMVFMRNILSIHMRVIAIMSIHSTKHNDASVLARNKHLSYTLLNRKQTRSK